MPMTVMTGMIEFFSAWPSTTRFWSAPLAHAVRM